MASSFGKYVTNVVKTALSSFSPNKVVAYSLKQYEAEYDDCPVLRSCEPHFYFLKVANHLDMTYIPSAKKPSNDDEAVYAFSLFRFQGDEDDGIIVFNRYVEILEPLNSARLSINYSCDRSFIERMTAFCREHCGWSAAHVAAALSWTEVFQTPILRDLVNTRDPLTGVTPLRIAIDASDLRLLDSLLGIPDLNLTEVDEYGNTVVHLAAKQASAEVLSALLARAATQTDINALNAFGDTALHTACQKPVRHCVELLLNSGADPMIGTTQLPLQLAVSMNAIDCVELICERCPEALNCPQPSDFAYPLHLASNSTMFRRLCEFGANPDAQDAAGLSALHLKVRDNDLDSVIYLLAHGADPNLTDLEGCTPLHYAIKHNASVHIIRALLVFEVDFTALDSHGRSARHLLCSDPVEYQHSEDRDLALYTLHAVGAERCVSNMNECTAGCVAATVAAQKNLPLFDGTAPAVTHYPNEDAANLFEEIFTSVQPNHTMYNTFHQRRFSRSSASVHRPFRFTRTKSELGNHLNQSTPLSDPSVNSVAEAPRSSSSSSSSKRCTFTRRRSYQDFMAQDSPDVDSSSSCRFTIDSDQEEGNAQTPINGAQPEFPSSKTSGTYTAPSQPPRMMSHNCTCDAELLQEHFEHDRQPTKDERHSSPDKLAPLSKSPLQSPSSSQPSDYSDHDPCGASDRLGELSRLPGSYLSSAYSQMLSKSVSRLNGRVNRRSRSKWNCGPCGYRVLSLDGGGIRGLILVQILRALERTTGRHITEMFDWIIGTSTGGILSLLLMRGKCLRCCRNLLFTFKDSVFYGKRPYPAEGFEKVVRRELGERTKMTDLKRIRVAITTLVSDRCPPVFHMFRNYTSPRLRLNKLLKRRQLAAAEAAARNQSKRGKLDLSSPKPCMKRISSLSNSSSLFEFLWNASGFRTGGDQLAVTPTVDSDTENQFDPIAKDSEQLVWMAARATGAAPTYFRPCGRFLDGGLISNNPTLDLLTEIQEMNLVQQMLDKPVSPIAVVVSLGTGRMPVEPIETVDVFRPNSLIETFRSAMGFSSLGRIVVELATMSEGPVVDRASAWCASLGVPFFRFSPRISLHVSLDNTDIKELLQMVWETEAYLYRARDRIEELATLLL